MCAIQVTPTLSTDRLLLRGLVIGDAGPIARLAGEPALAGMTPDVPHPYGIEDAEVFVEKAMTADWSREATFALEHRDHGLVGLMGLKTRVDDRAEAHGWVGKAFQNRGYGAEALRATLAWARRDWRKRAVWAGHFSDSPASGRALCKAGFLYTGDVELRASRARLQPAPTRMMVWLA
jgi:RimJ/RimL family protein N-acetyltransferase